jgi:hypothetical protein
VFIACWQTFWIIRIMTVRASDARLDLPDHTCPMCGAAAIAVMLKVENGQRFVSYGCSNCSLTFTVATDDPDAPPMKH